MLSIERHILRNFVYLHAMENNKPLPIGTQGTEVFDSRFCDDDAEDVSAEGAFFEDIDSDESESVLQQAQVLRTEKDFLDRAAQIYAGFESTLRKRFRWLRSSLFIQDLAQHLRADIKLLFGILDKCRDWDPAKDAKLAELYKLLAEKHSDQKVVVFTQFADTVKYLTDQLKAQGISKIEGVTGESSDPTELAWHFSPRSNEKQDTIKPADELRVLIATDVLSEGQNLQDCFIVINYDLPWAIIRLVQRAGRVDRIGQVSDKILCYSFLPAEGVERIIRLRARVRQRLTENAEVVGTDESFFEDDRNNQVVLDLYNEKAGILDGEDATEVDLASYAYQIWKNAISRDPSLEKEIPALPGVAFSTRVYTATEKEPEGVLVYLKTADGTDALARIGKDGEGITESQYAILRAAECAPDTPAIPRHEKHHELVKKGVELILEEEKSVGGQLGNKRGARFRTYERLKRFIEEQKGTLFDSPQLRKAVDAIYRYPLKQAATDTINKHLRDGVDDAHLADLVSDLWEEERLCAISEEEQQGEPRIICSMGLFQQR